MSLDMSKNKSHSTSLAVLALALTLFHAAVLTLSFPFGAAAIQGLGEQAGRAAACLLDLEKSGAALSPWSYIALAGAGKGAEVQKGREVCDRQFDKYRSSGELNDLSLTVLTLLAAEEDPYNWRGQDLVATLRSTQLPDGKFPDLAGGGGLGDSGEQVLANAHIWAVIALYAAGSAPSDPEAAKQWLLSRQLEGGGFNWYTGEKRPDVDSTGMALMALAALGEGADSPAVLKALSYLKSVQGEDGGFSSWGAPNAESCRMVVSALVSLGIDPCGEKWCKPGGKNPLSALLSYQLPDGSFEHVKGGGPNLMATEQALLALGDVIKGQTVFARLREKSLEKRTAPGMAAGRTVRFWIGRQQYEIEEGGQKKTILMDDAAPFIEGGRTFVPVRYLAYALGVLPEGVSWSEAEKRAELSLGPTRIALVEGSKELLINGSQVEQMDVAPLLLPPGRFYLPARYVAQALGYRVEWSEVEQMVIAWKET